MTQHPSFFLVLCSFAHTVFAFDLHEGCRVTDNFTVDSIKYDSVDFSVFLFTPVNFSKDGHRKQMLEVHLACQSSPHKNFDIITVNAQEVCVSTYRSLTKAQETIKTPQFPEGWNEFSLSLEGPYTLRDGHGTTWISYNKSSECVYSRIKVTGLLMRQCHKQMPTWEIEGPMKREVPLLSRGSTNFNEELILYSAEEFQPTFIISNIQLWIGWYNNSLEIREEASSLPVPRFTKRLFMSFIKEGSKMKLKVKYY